MFIKQLKGTDMWRLKLIYIMYYFSSLLIIIIFSQNRIIKTFNGRREGVNREIQRGERGSSGNEHMKLIDLGKGLLMISQAPTFY